MIKDAAARAVFLFHGAYHAANIPSPSPSPSNFMSRFPHRHKCHRTPSANANDFTPEPSLPEPYIPPSLHRLIEEGSILLRVDTLLQEGNVEPALR